MLKAWTKSNSTEFFFGRSPSGRAVRFTSLHYVTVVFATIPIAGLAAKKCDVDLLVL
jgi:hypothetical protein